MTIHFIIEKGELFLTVADTVVFMTTLTSPQNPLLKEVRRAVQRGTTTDAGFCVAESFHLMEEALRSDCEISTVFAAESVRTAVESHVRGLKKIRVIVLPDDLFRSISST